MHFEVCCGRAVVVAYGFRRRSKVLLFLVWCTSIISIQMGTIVNTMLRKRIRTNREECLQTPKRNSEQGREDNQKESASERGAWMVGARNVSMLDCMCQTKLHGKTVLPQHRVLAGRPERSNWWSIGCRFASCTYLVHDLSLFNNGAKSLLRTISV